MTTRNMLRHPSAFLPLLMSLTALGVVLAYLAVNGPAPQSDEGAAAHIWQLLMAAQVPLVFFFAVRWLPLSPRQGAITLALQAGAAVAALLPVYLLRW
jgi:hypothetical protein